MGDLNIQSQLFTFNYPNFPNYPEPDTELRCVMKHSNDQTFRLEILEVWVTSEYNLDQSLVRQFALFATTEYGNVGPPYVMINQFNRFINFTTFIGRDLLELRLLFSSTYSPLKFSLKIEGSVFLL